MNRFGSEQEAIEQFSKFLATKPAPDLERKARYELSCALTRLSQYVQAATEREAALPLPGEAEASRADHENVRRLLEALKGVAKQTVAGGLSRSRRVATHSGCGARPVEGRQTTLSALGASDQREADVAPFIQLETG